MSTPFLPARPDICLYVSGSNKCPLKVGVRIMTLRAGRFTPDERVEVAARTLTIPWRNAPSSTSRSSKVNPKEANSQRTGQLSKNWPSMVLWIGSSAGWTHQRGGMPRPTAPSSAGYSLDRLAYVSTGPLRPPVPPDLDTQAEAPPRPGALEGESPERRAFAPL